MMDIADEKESARLDALSVELSRFFDGRIRLDVARVCAAFVAYTLAEEYEGAPAEDGERALDRVIDFIRKTYQKRRDYRPSAAN